MLNRRTLRIKIMQSLFAFEQCKDANYLLAIDEIEDHFQPDLNSMEVQDKELLKKQRKSARQLLEKRFANPETPDGPEKVVNEAVDKAISQYHKQVKKDFQHFSKSLVTSVERINDYYYSVLGLLIALADVASSDKRSDGKNFINNRWIQSFRDNSELKKNLTRLHANLLHPRDLVRGWFVDIIKADAGFQQYNVQKDPSADDDKTIIKHIVRKLILGKSPINSKYDEDDIHWTEDQDIVRSLVDKTIKSWNEENRTIELQKLSLDWEDDKEFMTQLFAGTTGLDEKYKQLIARNTKNWEVDRLPLTDRIILEMAIAELITFPHIPVKVSINEYIEVAKLYSTPKSRQFINGILDVIAKELAQTGVMKKSGRGLIDNK